VLCLVHECWNSVFLAWSLVSCVVGVVYCVLFVDVICLAIVERREFGALAYEFECEVLLWFAIGALSLCESDFTVLS